MNTVVCVRSILRNASIYIVIYYDLLQVDRQNEYCPHKTVTSHWSARKTCFLGNTYGKMA